MVQSAFHQSLGEKFTFQQDNNVKDKAKSTLELLTKMKVNVPEWPSHSFDLNLLEKSLARHEHGCLAMMNNQFDRTIRILK